MTPHASGSVVGTPINSTGRVESTNTTVTTGITGARSLKMRLSILTDKLVTFAKSKGVADVKKGVQVAVLTEVCASSAASASLSSPRRREAFYRVRLGFTCIHPRLPNAAADSFLTIRHSPLLHKRHAPISTSSRRAKSPHQVRNIPSSRCRWRQTSAFWR